MEQQLYTSVLHALNSSGNPRLTDEERRECDSFLINLKERQECLQVLMHILTVSDAPGHTAYAQSLSLSLLKSWMTTWWNKLSINDQQLLKQQLLQLMNCPHIVRAPSRNIRIKLAEIISSVAVRQFPQYWPTFLGDMTSSIHQSMESLRGNVVDNYQTTCSEICMMSIEFIINDCVDEDFKSSLPTQRRQDIVGGFVAEQNLLLSTAFEFYSLCVALYFANANNATGEHVSNLANATIRMMLPLTAFIKVEDLCASGHDLSLVTVKLLSTPALQSEALDYLHAVCQHKLPLDIFTRLLDAINASPVSSLPDELEDSFLFQRNYAECVFSLLSNNFNMATSDEFLSQGQQGQAIELLGRHVMLMARLLDLPSLLLADDVHKSWITILKDDAVLKLDWMRDACMAVLKAYNSKLRRSFVKISGDQFEPVNDNVAAEFDDVNEWTEFFACFKSHVRILMGSCAVRFPLVSTTFLIETLEYLLTNFSTAADRLNKRRLSSTESTAFLEWEAFALTVESITNQINISADGVLPMLLRFLSILLSFNTPDPLLCYCKLKVLRHVFCVAVSSDDSVSDSVIQQVLQVIFSSINFDVTDVSTSSEKLRKLAAKSLSELCEQCAEKIAKTSFFSDLVGQIGALLCADLSTIVTPALKISLRESLVSLSDKMSTPGQRHELLLLALRDIIMLFTHELISSVLVSPDSFCKAVAESTQQAVSADDNISSCPITQLRFLLSTLNQVARSVTPSILPLEVWTSEKAVYNMSTLQGMFPFASVWQAILTNAIKALHTLHNIWHPSVRIPLGSTPSAAAIFFLPNAVEVMKRGGVPGAASIPIAKPSVGSEAGLAKTISDIRTYLYNLLGRAARQKALYVCEDHDNLLRDLAEAIPYMENEHVSLLLKSFVESYVLNLPLSHYDVAANFLEILMTSMLGRLSVAWGISSTNGSVVEGSPEALFFQSLYQFSSIPNAYAGLTEDQLELARHSLVYNLTQQYSDFLGSLCGCRGQLCTKVIIAATATASAPSSSSSGPKGVGVGDLSDVSRVGKTTDGDGFTLVLPKSKKKKGGSAGKKGKSGGSGGGMSNKGETRVANNNNEWSGASGNDEDGLNAKDAEKLRQNAIRREALQKLLTLPRFEKVTKAFTESCVALMCLPNPTVLNRALQLADFLLEQCAVDPRVIPAVGKDIFSAAIVILLKEEKWATGYEMDLVVFATEVYCRLVIGVSSQASSSTTPTTSATFFPSTKTQSNVSGHSSTMHAGIGGVSQGLRNPALCGYPRDVLCGIPRVTPDMILSLEDQLTAVVDRRKRRDIMKEFLTTTLSLNNAGGAEGSYLSKNLPSVMNICAKMPKPPKVEIPKETYNISSLFDSDI